MALVALLLGAGLLPGGAAGAAGAAAKIYEVEITRLGFSPGILSIAQGDTVRWVNLDSRPHAVRGLLDASDIASPQIAPGGSYEFTFNLPGRYQYYLAQNVELIGQVNVAGGQESVRFETGYTVSGPFLRYWRTHGLEFGDYNISYRESLALFGLPLTEAFEERLENGNTYLVQYFERARFEWHPENDAPYDVLLGQFGRAIHPAEPPVARRSGALYYEETGHNVGDAFRDFHGGAVALFGYPITEVFEERLGDGRTYQVQYFERARLESHPENVAPYDVLLGQFGREIMVRRGVR